MLSFHSRSEAKQTTKFNTNLFPSVHMDENQKQGER